MGVNGITNPSRLHPSVQPDPASFPLAPPVTVDLTEPPGMEAFGDTHKRARKRQTLLQWSWNPFPDC